jgi:urease accessory protein
MPHRLFLLALLAAASPAAAHHPMGGEVPRTLWHGLLSGIGHPVIGLDHLTFLIAAGVLAAGAARPWPPVLAFLAAGFAGTLLHLAGIGLGPVQAMIAASLLAAGGLLLAGGAAGMAVLATLFAAAGLFHGHAFAEAVVGAEPTPVIAYLAGLALMQGAVMAGVVLATRRIAARRDAPPLGRWAGAAACAAGVVAGALALAG